MSNMHLIEQLPIVVLHPHNSCNCRCVMCDFWRVGEVQEIYPSDLQLCAKDFRQLGVKWIVVSGGEPLIHSDIFSLISVIKEIGIRITVLSNGLLMAQNAASLVHAVNDIVVSLDGQRMTHDRIRGIPGAFDLLCDGIRTIHKLRPEFPISARCTVQSENYSQLIEIVKIARDLGLRCVSFLAVDLNSAAFGRSEKLSASRQAMVGLNEEEVEILEQEVAQIINEDKLCEGFVLESPTKLQRIVQHFRAHLGHLNPTAPYCNAPWVSAVIESDGAVRPCFFHESIGNIREQPLLQIINGDRALNFREHLNITQDPICCRCVCSLNLKRNE